MTGGRRREVISIQQKTDAVLESGQVETTWSDFATGIRAAITTPSGREFFGHDKLNAQASHVVNIRWLDGVLPDMRVVWGSRILNIEYVSEDRKHACEMWLYCKEVRDNG